LFEERTMASGFRVGWAALVLLCSLSLAGCGGGGASLAKRAIAPPGASTIAPYTPGIGANGFVFFSGQIGLRPGTTELIAGGVQAEARQALENLTTLLRTSGLNNSDIVKCTVFLIDMRDFEAVNEIYGAYFRGTTPPARSAVGVAALPASARVEIECIAATS
jgi:2-iminobutanoate/2-iminopropanoate deaminase